MRRPFEQLVEMIDALDDSDRDVTLGDLSKRWKEPVERIMDALDASKMLRGQKTYITLENSQDD
jgi:hypothetical protein